MTDSSKAFDIQSLYSTRNVVQMTNVAKFWVCHQYGDLHIRGDVVE